MESPLVVLEIRLIHGNLRQLAHAQNSRIAPSCSSVAAKYSLVNLD
jgi:hypothetical protein